jgi:hypothetical protein
VFVAVLHHFCVKCSVKCSVKCTVSWCSVSFIVLDFALERLTGIQSAAMHH